MLGKPGVVVLREKHRFARWISLNVAGVSEPLRINLSNQEQDKYFDFLDSQEANASMQITLARNAEGALAIEALGEAPTGEPAGEPLTADISGADAVTLSADGSTATFVVPGQGRLSYEIPVDQLEVREQITALVAETTRWWLPPCATALRSRWPGNGSIRSKRRAAMHRPEGQRGRSRSVAAMVAELGFRFIQNFHDPFPAQVHLRKQRTQPPR